MDQRRLELGDAKSDIFKSCVYKVLYNQQLTKFSKDVVSFTTGKKKRLQSRWDADNSTQQQHS